MRISDWSSDVCSSDLADAVARLVRRMRLLEIDRQTAPRRPGIPAKRVFGIYGIALLAITFLGVSPAISFLAAALAICLLRLLPADEAYGAIDLPVLVLLAAMIPIGRAFDDAGGTAAIASALGWLLAGSPLFLMLALICGVSMLLSIFLNNLATALVMGHVGAEIGSASGRAIV